MLSVPAYSLHRNTCSHALWRWPSGKSPPRAAGKIWETWIRNTLPPSLTTVKAPWAIYINCGPSMGVVPCSAVEKWLHAFVFRLDISFILFCWLNKKKRRHWYKICCATVWSMWRVFEIDCRLWNLRGMSQSSKHTHTQTRTHCYVSLVTAVSQQSVGALFQI